ncbi:hypothetical protein C8R47DRAFT_1080346 [Mycena vitilis]|nr:hypothetical protein C8R47DRAFT_1080346 [Mycena vitilis]
MIQGSQKPPAERFVYRFRLNAVGMVYDAESDFVLKFTTNIDDQYQVNPYVASAPSELVTASVIKRDRLSGYFNSFPSAYVYCALCVAQTMPTYEILHSAEYWQSIRRAKAAREARKRQAPRVAEEISGHWDGAAVVTFVPGNPIPYTSVLYANNKLVPVGASASTSATDAQPRRRKRVTRPITMPLRGSNVVRRCQEREDAELLARLAAPRTGEKRVGSEEGPSKR